MTQSSNNPVVLMIRPDTICIQEVKVIPAKAKVSAQGDDVKIKEICLELLWRLGARGGRCFFRGKVLGLGLKRAGKWGMVMVEGV